MPARFPRLLLSLIVCTVMFGVGTWAFEATAYPTSGSESVPAVHHREIAGTGPRRVLESRPVTGYPGEHRRGREVPSSAAVERSKSYGLADCRSYLGTTYPVRHRATGWVIVGPEFYRAAAQGNQGVEYIHASLRRIVAWGGSLITSDDGGTHWSRSIIGSGIRVVNQAGHTLTATVFPDPLRRVDHRYQTWRYRSRDGGHRWTYQGPGKPAASLGPVASNGSTRPTCG
jgi:hypothetical protein